MIQSLLRFLLIITIPLVFQFHLYSQESTGNQEIIINASTHAAVISSLNRYELKYGKLDTIVKNSIIKFSNGLEYIEIGHYRGTNGINCLDDVLNDMLSKLSGHEHYKLVCDLNIWAQGWDGSSTQTALRKLNSTIGKYYVLEADVYQIQTDRDYPRSGRNEFNMFGGRKIAEPDSISYMTFHCISKIKIPPYRLAAVFGKITGYSTGYNRAGKRIIIPELKILALASVTPYMRAGESNLYISN